MSTYHIDLKVTSPDGTTHDLEGDLALSVTPPPSTDVAPTITSQPQSTSVAPGTGTTLTVVATGTPPLSYQWGKNGVPIAGATNASYATGPLTATTSYNVVVTNAVGHVTSNSAVVTVIPVTPTVGIGLTFVRTIGLPSLNMAYAYGDCSGRIVNGRVRLIFSGDEVNVHSPIYEVEVTDAPVATFVQQWLTPYNGKRGTWVTGADLLATAEALEDEARRRKLAWLIGAAAWYRRLGLKTPKTGYTWVDFANAGTPAVNGGHYYHAAHDLLYVSYADSYNVAGRPDWCVVGIRLHPDGTAETWGPWRPALTDGDGTLRQGPRAVMNFREEPTSGRMLGSTTLGSGNVGYPWGANLVGAPDWPTTTSPAGPTVPDLVFADRRAYYYYMGAVIDPVTGVANGPVRSMRRPRDPYIYESFAGVQANFVNPDAYQHVGSWTDNDSCIGFLPLPDRTYFFGGVAGSHIQDKTNPKAAHVWYANEHNNFRCNHGIDAVPAGITGPVCTARYPYAAMFAQTDLERVRTGQLIDWHLEPVAWSNLEADFGIVTAPVESVGNAKMVASGFFDPRTRDLYLIAHGADQGTITWGLVNASIHQFKVA